MDDGPFVLWRRGRGRRATTQPGGPRPGRVMGGLCGGHPGGGLRSRARILRMAGRRAERRSRVGDVAGGCAAPAAIRAAHHRHATAQNIIN